MCTRPCACCCRLARTATLFLTDPGDLRRRGRLVDRHGNRTHCPDRVVGEHPLVPGTRQQHNRVSRRHPGAEQPTGQLPHLRGQLRASHRHPSRRRTPAGGHTVRPPGSVRRHVIDQGRLRCHLHHRRFRVLPHSPNPAIRIPPTRSPVGIEENNG